MPEKIGVTYRQVGRLPAYHTALFYEKGDGSRVVLEATSENVDFMDAAEQREATTAESSSRQSAVSPFGRMIVRPERAWDSRDPFVSDHKNPYKILAEGDDLSAAWKRIQDTANDVNDTGYWYRVLSQNSNTFTTTAAERAGLPIPNGAAIDPILRTVHIYSAFGSDSRLSDTVDRTPDSDHGPIHNEMDAVTSPEIWMGELGRSR